MDMRTNLNIHARSIQYLDASVHVETYTYMHTQKMLCEDDEVSQNEGLIDTWSIVKWLSYWIWTSSVK